MLDHRRFVYFLIILSPLFPMVATFLSSKNTLLQFAFSGLKDVFIVLSMILMCVQLNQPFIKKNMLDLSLFTFAIISTLHIIGMVKFSLVIDGVRYSLIYILWGLIALFSIRQDKFNLSFEKIIHIIGVQFIVLTIFGVYEYFNPDFINLLYGVSNRSEVIYAKFASENRLVGTFYNPIIYSAFQCVGISSLYFLAEKANNKISWALFYFFWAAALFVVVFSYSRLGLMTYISLSFLMIIRNLKRNEIVSMFFVFVALIFLIPLLIKLVYENPLLFERVVDLGSSNTFSENSRITNWLNALNIFEDTLVYYLWGTGLGGSLPGAEIKIENGFITMFFELGVFGFISFVVFNITVLLVLFQSNIHPSKKFFYCLFFVLFYLMNIGNDFVKVFPLSFYYWLFLMLFFKELSDYDKKGVAHEL